MRHRTALTLLLLLAPGPAQAQQDAPEDLLPAGTQLYVRWDGIDAHRAAYARSSLGQLMQGDAGTFITSLVKQLEDGAAQVVTVGNLLAGEPPAKLKQLRGDARSAAQLVSQLGGKGFVLGVEVRSLEPPQGQVTLILPGGAAKPEPLFGALRLGTGLAKAQVKEAKVEGRAVSSLDLEGVSLAWWVEGKHAVLTLGTDKPEAAVKAMTAGTHPRLTSSPLFKRLRGFDRFETVARAFVDSEALVKLGERRNAEVRRLLTDLGLDGLKSLVFYSGFDGRMERDLVEWDMPGPRKGLLTLLNGKPFHLGDVPALPPDVVSWSMTNFDLASIYDTGLKAAEDVVRLVSPDDVAKVKGFPKAANDLLGIDLRQDLLASLGDRLAAYTSPGDGPFTLGQTLLYRVKDADKLQGALDQAIKSLGAASNVEVRIKKRPYKGVDMRVVQVKQQGFVFVPTYAVLDGWLVLGFFPQPVEGYIARAKGDLPAWKPSPAVEESLRQLPAEFISISYSDPRPSVKQLLSIAPLIGGSVASFSPELNFDVSTLPNAQEVTRHLFPNVSVTTDDGKTLRNESRGSVALPFDITGLDTYSLFFIFAAFGGFAF
jgi:hypothetical protein